MLSNKIKIHTGFALVEVIFAAAIFTVVAVAIYQGLASITTVVSVSRDKVAATNLVNSEFELIRNLAFNDVGLQSGIPSGVIVPSSVVDIDGRSFSITRVVRNIDDPFDGTIGGSPNDLSPADYKMVEIRVVCNDCKKPVDLTANSYMAPKNLETASTNGALFVKVFDASGNPVPQANVHITNSGLGIDINETTDNNGVLAIVDAPPAENSYRIVVTKAGFTTDRTYPPSVGNPNPVKRDATVLLQQLTEISFIIDRVSSIDLNTVTNTCGQVLNVPFQVNGTKLIGVSPDVYKWTGNFTSDTSGYKSISDLEWDVFSFTTSGGFYLAGTNPISPISILPNSNQEVDLVITLESPSFLLVKVRDAATRLPISGATVTLDGGSFNQSLVTDQGYFRQTDWSGGSGQTDFSDPTRYHYSDGNIEINGPAGELKLLSSMGHFVSNGEIISSVFDAGGPANWSVINVLPTDQPPETGLNPVRFQIATSALNEPETVWDFVGPDGTGSTFYTINNSDINPIHDGHRYLKYKILLSTVDQDFTPNVSEISISFASACIPPGQVLFFGLSQQNYNLNISAPGYLPQSISNININSNWQSEDILLSP
jgi:hypothetical protein